MKFVLKGEPDNKLVNYGIISVKANNGKCNYDKLWVISLVFSNHFGICQLVLVCNYFWNQYWCRFARQHK